VQSVAADQGEHAADRPGHDLAVDDLSRIDGLRLLHGRQVGLVEADAEQPELRMAIERVVHPAQPAGLEVGDDQVRVGDHERIAHRRRDAVVERAEELVGRAEDQLVEAMPVRRQPVAHLRAGCVVDDRQAVGRVRTRLEGGDRRLEVRQPVVREHDDVGGRRH
jgi:hypothetical protein